MSDPLLDSLDPYFSEVPAEERPDLKDATTQQYLSRLTTLPLNALTGSEPLSLTQSSQSTNRSLQALSTRSGKALVESADELTTLSTSIPKLGSEARRLREGISTLDDASIRFAEKYSRSGENEVLDRRKRALLMLRNVDRLSEVLELPTLLASAINSTAAQSATASSNYASALDLHTHIRRLHQLYPDSELIGSVYAQAEASMKEMKTNLISSLRGQNIKLAAGMRTIGWLRRIAPELAVSHQKDTINTGEGSFGALFLVCRLANLLSMLDALEPLRALADQETERQVAMRSPINATDAWSGGQQTERYLKRYIEIFREQSFAIVSMFRSIFPSNESEGQESLSIQFKSLGLKSPIPNQMAPDRNDPLQPLPSALAMFPLHLVDLLSETLKQYLPNVRDRSSRESLFTQILYCAGSLGRLGGDFSMVLANLEDDNTGEQLAPDWAAVMKKHRVLAGRLESLASNTQPKGVAKSSPADLKRTISKSEDIIENRR